MFAGILRGLRGESEKDRPMRSPPALVPPAQVSSGENSPRKLQNVVADSRAIYRRHFAVMILTVASRLNSERKSRKMESCLTKTMVARTESERQDSLADSTDAESSVTIIRFPKSLSRLCIYQPQRGGGRSVAATERRGASPIRPMPWPKLRPNPLPTAGTSTALAESTRSALTPGPTFSTWTSSTSGFGLR